MRFRFMSDLHLEFEGRNGAKAFVVPPMPEDSRSVLVLAGDIDVDKHAVKLARRTASRFRAIVQIAGNHEYYKGGSPQRLPTKLCAALAEHDNVHFLDNASVDIDNVRIIGSTLWSDFKQGNDIAMHEATMSINDFRRIRVGTADAPYARKFSPADALELHTRSRHFVFSEIKKAHSLGLKPVVVTHHAPTLPEGPDGSLISFAYGSDLTEEIVDTKPAIWVHGHLHESLDYLVGDTRIVCNPRGYFGVELNDAFDLYAAVDV